MSYQTIDIDEAVSIADESLRGCKPLSDDDARKIAMVLRSASASKRKKSICATALTQRTVWRGAK